MPISTIDPTSALLIIDLQEGLVSLPTLDSVRDVASRAGELAAAFRRNDQPVILVNAAGIAPGRTEQGEAGAPDFPAGFTDLLPELGRHDADHTLTKHRWGAFHDTGLSEHLTALGVTQVVVAGVATSVGVESTARAAYDHGFHVVVATDAVTDVNKAAHENSLDNIFPHLGETGTVAEIVSVLEA